jgi:glutamate--cysteine ligase
MPSSAEVLGCCDDLHRFVYRHIGDERLVGASMPCVLGGGATSRWPATAVQRRAMKTVYRRGLGNRYGRVMQIIAGVHFNFSVDDALWPRSPTCRGHRRRRRAGRAERYMGMVRNLQRLGWLVPYLFGASPAVCKSFVQDATTDLESFDANTSTTPTPPPCAWATSAIRTARKRAPA